jgi:WD40 repeat protein
MNQCLLSAGLDYEAFVWNTYVKDKIFLLRGYNHPLVGVKFLSDTPQIITDTSGMVKIWDVRNFLYIQTFNFPTDELAAFSLTYSTSGSQSMKKRIICGNKSLNYFEYDEPKDQLLDD